MAVYEYTAKDETGREFFGTYYDVDSVAVLRDELSKTGYALVSAQRAKGLAGRRKRIKRQEVVAFAYKFAGMYSAGLSVMSCLETLEEQAENYAFKRVIADIRQSVETGSNLKRAFERHAGIFSDFFLGMIEAGETSGKLSTSLGMSAEYLEKQAELRQKVKSAFLYPIVVGIVCVVVVICLLVFIVPIFSKLYERMHVSLPAPTQVLVVLSYLVGKWWWALLIVAVAAVLMLRRWKENPRVKAKWDTFKLKMPIFAKLNRMVVVSQFTRTFAMLASVGVPLIEALEVASQVAHNYKVTQIAKELQQALRAGNPVAASFKAYDIFPPMVIQLAAAGEQAGVLPEMLNKGADVLDRDIDRTVNSLLVKLEPAMTLIMGAIVGLILMGVYLPMFDYMRYMT